MAAAAQAMRDLSLSDRNALIAAAGDKVHDLRPVLAHKIKQRQLEKSYRSSRRPRDRA